MNSPLPLPDWVPWWVHLALLLAGLIFGLLFLLMPFSVFGVKARLEGIEARLDEIQGEIRTLALRLPESGADEEQEDYEVHDEEDRPLPRPQLYGTGRPVDRPADRPAGRPTERYVRPPIPPAPLVPPSRGGEPPRGPARSEPRLF